MFSSLFKLVSLDSYYALCINSLCVQFRSLPYHSALWSTFKVSSFYCNIHTPTNFDSPWTTKSHTSLPTAPTYLSSPTLLYSILGAREFFFSLPWALPTLSFLWTYGPAISCHWHLPFNIYLYLSKSYLFWMVCFVYCFLHDTFIFSLRKWYVLLGIRLATLCICSPFKKNFLNYFLALNEPLVNIYWKWLELYLFVIWFTFYFTSC